MILTISRLLVFNMPRSKSKALRRGTRKDYCKMDAGTDLEIDDHDGEQPCSSKQSKSDDYNTDGGERTDGEIVNKEIFLDQDDCSSGIGADDDGDSSTDNEVIVAKSKLLSLKKEQKKLLKKEKLQRIADEKEVV